MNILMMCLNIVSRLKMFVHRIHIHGVKNIYIRRRFRMIGSGKKVHIDGSEGVYIGPNSMITCAEDAIIEIGTNFHATEHLRLTSLKSVVIGNNVLLGSDVTIIDSNHGMNAGDLEKGYNAQKMLKKTVHINDNVWCGDRVIVLPGVTIGEGTIIGAGSIVTRDIPPYCIAAGNPARVIKKWNKGKTVWETVR